MITRPNGSRLSNCQHYKGIKVLSDEVEKGKVNLWLNPKQLGFLINEWSKLPDNAPEEVLKEWSDIIFRINTALHKSGNEKPERKIDTKDKYYYFPNGLEDYLLKLSTEHGAYDPNYIIHLLVALLENLRKHHLESDLEDYLEIITEEQSSFLKKIIDSRKG